MKYTIVTLLLFTVLVTSSVTFDDAFALPKNEHIQSIVIFDKKTYDENGAINLICKNVDFTEGTKVKWSIKKDSGDIVDLTHEILPNNEPFLAKELLENNHMIKCKIIFGNIHSSSSNWVTLSNFELLLSSDDLVVNLAGLEEITNFADINYNPITHDISIEWDFGTKDNRENCYAKTRIGIDYTVNGTTAHHSSHTFFGTDLTLYDVRGMPEKKIVNEDMAIISCEGDFTFNITDFEILDNFSGFEFWMSFYEKIDGKPQILNEVGMIYLEDRLMKLYSCYGNAPDLYTEYYYDTERALKITGVDKVNNECKSTNELHNGVNEVDYASVDSITYADYPTHNTHNTHNTQKKNGGGGSPPPPPTFGKNTNYNQIVTDGFCFNGICVDVDKLHTNYSQINAPVGDISTITTKSHNPSGGLDGLKWIQVILGLKEAGIPLSNGEVVATFYLDKTEIDKVEIVDKNNLIELYELSTDTVQCSDEYTTECLELSFSFIPRDKLIHNVVGINVVNFKNSGSTNYLNHGIEFHGESMNEPLISYVSASNGGAFYPQDRGTVQLTMTSYSDNKWQDTFGHMWEYDFDNKTFRIISDITVPLKEPDVKWSAMTRMNSNFDSIIIHEQDRAILVFDSTKLISKLSDSFAYDLPKSAEEQQAELDIRISNEIDRLLPLTKDYTKNQHLYQKDSYNHWNYFGDMTVSEINQLDMKNKQRLQDEMLQQRLDDKAKYG